MRKSILAALMGLALVGTAGVAAAAYAGQSIWGDANPGQGSDHAAMPEAGAIHNQAGAEHPPEDAGAPEDAGMPAELPEQADSHAQENYPPSTGRPAE
jgi:hypothetical protein